MKSKKSIQTLSRQFNPLPRVTIARTALEEIEEALRVHGRLEIGGMLFGEMTGPNQFLIHEATVADDVLGTFVSFVRYPGKSLRKLSKFFQRHQFNYRKFNYLGEWHSHPSFALEPSNRDVNSMLEILRDTKGVQFAILVIGKLALGKVQLKGFLFHGGLPIPIEFNIDPQS